MFFPFFSFSSIFKWMVSPGPLTLHSRETGLGNETILTNSTAQGSGGNFKDRKPIGEVGCCDAWMSERTHWRIDRRLNLRVSLFFYLSISLCLFLSFSLCFSVSPSLSIYLYPPLVPSLSLTLYLSIYLSVCLPVCLPACLSISLSIYLSIYLSTYLPTYLPTYLSIYLSTVSIYLSLSKQFCETSSKSGTWQVQDEASLRDFLLKFEVGDIKKRSKSVRLPSLLLHLSINRKLYF